MSESTAEFFNNQELPVSQYLDKYLASLSHLNNDNKQYLKSSIQKIIGELRLQEITTNPLRHTLVSVADPSTTIFRDIFNFILFIEDQLEPKLPPAKILDYSGGNVEFLKSDLPDFSADLNSFITAWKKDPKRSEAILAIILNNLSIIGHTEIQIGMIRAISAAKKFVNKRPYGIIVHDIERSGGHYLKNFMELKRNSLNAPAFIYSSIQEEFVYRDDRVQADGAEVGIILDDWVLSGQQLKDLLNDPEIDFLQSKNIGAFFVGGTRYPREEIYDIGKLYYAYQIPTLNEILNPEEIELFQKWGIVGSSDSSFQESVDYDHLTFGVYGKDSIKVPDTFAPITKERCEDLPAFDEVNSKYILDEAKYEVSYDTYDADNISNR